MCLIGLLVVAKSFALTLKPAPKLGNGVGGDVKIGILLANSKIGRSSQPTDRGYVYFADLYPSPLRSKNIATID